jgi:hypothetical protein
MKLRTGFALLPSIAFALTALPAALTEAGLGLVPGAERVSFAQGAPTPGSSDGVTEIARQRYQEGVKDFDAGRYEEARAAFLQAYALKRAPAVLLNVALSELRSPVNHADEAGTHFQQFLREATTATPEQRATAEKGIADAKKRAGIIVVTVDASGADVSIDGTTIGKAPLPDPVFVKPGKHTVVAQFQGHTAAIVVETKAGTSATANLTTGVTVAANATPSTGPLATPGSTLPPGGSGASPGRAGPGTGEPGNAQVYPPGQGSGGPGMVLGAGAGADQATGTREPLGQWYQRKPIAWVGTGVAGVGFVMGLSASIAAGAASAATANHVDQIKVEAKNRNTKLKGICGNEETGAGAIPHFVNACAQLRKDVGFYNTSVAFAVTGWVLFGVGAVGTTIYAVVDWRRPRAPAATAFQPRVLAVTPVLSPNHQGIGVVGSF